MRGCEGEGEGGVRILVSFRTGEDYGTSCVLDYN